LQPEATFEKEEETYQNRSEYNTCYKLVMEPFPVVKKIMLQPDVTCGKEYLNSKGFALTWYRALTWYSLRLNPPRTHFEPGKAVGTQGRGSLAAR